MCSGFLNAACMLGEFLGSVLGGFLLEYMGYQKGSLIVCLICLTVIYMYFNMTDVYNDMKLGRKKFNTCSIELDDVPFK
jgi:predicted MFS family arabinose efflux permease